MGIVRKYIVVKTGLHIGGSSDYEIGSIDNVVVRDPEGYPYIPGSSLKGKMRSLLELETKLSNQKGEGPCDCGDCAICEAFGFSRKDEKGVGKILFRDALVPTSVNLNYKFELPLLFRENETDEFFEIKFENVIDRKKGTTKGGGLRQMERVVPGTVFKLELIYKDSLNESLKKYEGKINSVAKTYNVEYKEDKLAETLINIGIKLLELDYLGGSGTRGYGSIAFVEGE